MTSGHCPNFKQPNTLKECLQLLAKLGESWYLRPNVISTLKGALAQYTAGGQDGMYLDNLFKDDSVKGNFAQTCIYSNSLLKKILKNHNIYGPYNHLETCHGQQIAEALKTWLPQVYSALYFLYYNAYEDCSGIGGHLWSGMHVDGTTQLGSWLRDEIDKVEPTKLLKRGFKDQLKTGTAFVLGAYLQGLVSHSSANNLQWTLAGLLFISDWHPSLTGHALCFLYTFCSKVQNEALQANFEQNLKDVKWSKFKSVCQGLGTSLQPFIGQSATSGLYAVCRYNTNLYASVLGENMSPDQFKEDLKWLKDQSILDRLIIALSRMKLDSAQWKPDNLKMALTAGPFRFGFVPKQNVTWDNIQQTLSSKIDMLVKELGTLSYILNPIIGSIVTGLIGATHLGLEALDAGLNAMQKEVEAEMIEEEGKEKPSQSSGNAGSSGGGQRSSSSSDEEREGKAYLSSEVSSSNGSRTPTTAILVASALGGLGGLGTLAYLLRFVL